MFRLSCFTECRGAQFISYMFLSMIQWSDHCVLCKSFCGVFVWALALLCVWFAVSLDETQVWLVDLRSSGWSVCWLSCRDLPAFRTFSILVQITFLLLMLM